METTVHAMLSGKDRVASTCSSIMSSTLLRVAVNHDGRAEAVNGDDLLMLFLHGSTPRQIEALETIGAAIVAHLVTLTKQLTADDLEAMGRDPGLRDQHGAVRLTGGAVPGHVAGAYPNLSCCGGPVPVVPEDENMLRALAGDR